MDDIDYLINRRDQLSDEIDNILERVRNPSPECDLEYLVFQLRQKTDLSMWLNQEIQTIILKKLGSKNDAN